MASFSMDSRCHFAGNVQRRFDKYWQYLLPPPADPVAYIYRQAFDKGEWMAMRYLKEKRPKALNLSRTFELYWTDNTDGTSKCPHVTFKFSDKMTMPTVGIKLSDLSQDVQNAFRPWICSVNRYRSLSKELRRRCQAVMGNPTGVGDTYSRRKIRDLDPRCNTPGQLIGIWPELQPFFESAWKRDIQLRSVKPRPPKRVGLIVHTPDGSFDHWATPAEFHCETDAYSDTDRQRLAEINEVLVMMSIHDVPALDDYPSFHGKLDFEFQG